MTSKAWRKDPKIKNSEVRYLLMAPFAVVAYISKGNFIHIGVARCNPTDTFNEESGALIACKRAQLQYATHLGLVSERRIRALNRKAERNPNPLMATLTKRQFKERFLTTP